jgi:hypothetical protein
MYEFISNLVQRTPLQNFQLMVVGISGLSSMIGVIRNVGPCMKNDVHHLIGIRCKEYKENLVINDSSKVFLTLGFVDIVAT